MHFLLQIKKRIGYAEHVISLRQKAFRFFVHYNRRKEGFTMAQPTQSNTFTSGPILLPFIRFTLPILLSMFLQALYSAVDLIVISRYCGAAEIAAVAAGGNVMYMIQVVVTGLAMGVTVAIGRYIGEGNFEDAAKSMGSSICVFAAFGALLTAIMLIAAPFLIRAMDMPPEAYPFAVDYLMICSAGILF